MSELEKANKPVKAPRKNLSRDAWVAAARKVLEKRGIAEVKIDGLARKLKVTRGSFYFHFKSLNDLHDELLNEWRCANCAPFVALREASYDDGLQLFTDIVHVWVDEAPFSPALDLATRDWSRTSASLAREVEENDNLRMVLLTEAFQKMGYSEDESIVRARITYFHQIGQYALSFKEARETREQYQPLFGSVLLGPLVEDPNLKKR
ncbi:MULTISPECIES: TetR/AcrR family transcriptional regulator [Roseobacteraceae]|uniref:Bacterial regulatory protein, tetR family n=1 Tax=Pseudosulfitobacter pseudonitzschiae TaxID=1402135 RepID=A0A221K6C7_9RHOB|nr:MULTISPECIES: TetR/AcrR family transcriptional regulator [Roseobacteraceae]ASM74526.1 bacterial regulatory protein, tetR family [Pseudosulfitobacter pseudonitzschiae]